MLADEYNDGLPVFRETAEVRMLHWQFGAIFQLNFKWRFAQGVFKRLDFHDLNLGFEACFVELNWHANFSANFSPAHHGKSQQLGHEWRSADIHWELASGVRIENKIRLEHFVIGFFHAQAAINILRARVVGFDIEPQAANVVA